MAIGAAFQLFLGRTFKSISKKVRRCPCGLLLDGGKVESKPYTCTASQIRRDLSRISDLLLDRIDTHVELPRLSSDELMGKREGELSACVRKRVVESRKRQIEQMRGMGLICNAQLKAKGFRDYCDMDARINDLLKAAIAQFSLSGRGYDRILKVSRTIADLEDSESIQLHHVAETINHQAFDRKLFG